MISAEQKELADYVKQVHLSLRRKSRQIGAKNAWEEHLKNEETLRNYAMAMKKLAEDYWSVNNKNNSESLLCRIEWIVNQIVEYFQKGSFEKENEKERKKLELFSNKGLTDCVDFNLKNNLMVQAPYKVLDVGSCYNPFGKFDFLEVYPIDLYPALPSVKKCNFLKVEIVKAATENWFTDNLTEIPCFFDVVVFSLFLEYLPSPEQRYIACQKAYHCLKPMGLLIIVTPDSKHATANAHLMKSWKLAAANIGFIRICLEKLRYLYCMTFRKSSCKLYPLLLNNIKQAEVKLEKMFIIPQDSVDYKIQDKKIEENFNEKELKDTFVEMPFLSQCEDDVDEE